MTAGTAGKLTCDIQGCNVTTAYTSRQGLLSHMKKKHDPQSTPGTSSQTPNIQMPENNVIQDDTEDIAEAIEDQELYTMLDDLAEVIKDKLTNTDTSDGLDDKISRLRKVIEAKSKIQKAAKVAFDEEMKKRSEVEADQIKAIDNLRDRNLSILRESKKKKATVKALANDKDEFSKEITVLRVKNGILVKENSTLKIDIENKSKYIKQLEDANAPEASDEVEVAVEEEQPIVVEMNRESPGHECNACNRTFTHSIDLDRHIEAKHSPVICTFCDEEFTSKHELKTHTSRCMEYGNSVVNCSKCNQTFTRFGIKRHSDNCHEKRSINVYSCAECGKRAHTLEEIKKHQKSHHAEVIEVSKEVCKHWRNGNCYNGIRCRFSHVGHQNKNTSYPTPRPNTDNSRTAACKHGDSCSWLEKGTCRFFHKGVGVQMPSRKSQVTSKKSTVLCKHNQKCWNKSTCPYKHSIVNFSGQRKQHRPPMRVQTVGRHNQ